ncbi:hypothetical protein [Haladaptatus caseinilyticus]|uniref:hypothetical protein n=1 Tax=Haladaptatus caseinilyticus TaxID=2993314 RepID=UPI00224B1E8F|nr:hypothetical protein [Haladaptatus caseinilyticus]
MTQSSPALATLVVVVVVGVAMSIVGIPVFPFSAGAHANQDGATNPCPTAETVAGGTVGGNETTFGTTDTMETNRTTGETDSGFIATETRDGQFTTGTRDGRLTTGTQDSGVTSGTDGNRTGTTRCPTVEIRG